MKKWLLISVFVLMIGWTLYQTLADSSSDNAGNPEEESLSSIPEEEIGLEQGEYAPDFTLQNMEGESVSLSDYRGEKKVMLNFWATWCPPCRAEMPDMQKVYENRDDMVILAINLTETETGVATVKQFQNEFGLTFPILLDLDVSVASRFDIKPVPTSFLIDSTGKIEHVSLGPMNEETMVHHFDQME